MKPPACCEHYWVKKSVCHFLLVADMIGIEAFLAVEFIMMVGNIQTLGVPVVYSSLPGVMSAAVCGVSMPLLGFIADNYATTKCSKAFVLVLVNIVQILGGVLVFLANTIQLFFSDPHEPLNDSDVTLQYSTPPQLADVIPGLLMTESLKDYLQNNFTTGHPVLNNATVLTEESEGSFPMTGILAIIGYSLIDAGYDISNCFLKTFIMAITPPEDHSEVIVKSIFVGSFGGCLITLIGSLGIGKLLTAGTSYDANATECAFLAGVSVIIMLLFMIVSLLTGLLYRVDDKNLGEESVYSYEKADSGVEKTPNSTKPGNPIIEERIHLLMDSIRSTRSTDFTIESVEMAWSFSQSSTHTLLEHSSLVTNRTRKYTGLYGSSMLVSSIPTIPEENGVREFFLRNRCRIFLCLATFFSCGAHYAFNMYSVNFVAVTIFHGDPSASVGAQEYANYLDGMQAGSIGFILLYVAFVLAALSQNFILQRQGWWSETCIGSIIFIGVNLACVLSTTTIAYYITASLNGFFRALVFTVPYIVVDKVVRNQQAKGQVSRGANSLDIVMIAAMWPCAFAMCSGVMGPLLDWTGNVATPIYYTIVTSALGLLMFWLVKKY